MKNSSETMRRSNLRAMIITLFLPSASSVREVACEESHSDDSVFFFVHFAWL